MSKLTREGFRAMHQQAAEALMTARGAGTEQIIPERADLCRYGLYRQRVHEGV